MGSGGQRNNSDDEVFKRAPASNPPFTLSDIKKAVPPHCFNRSLLRSSSYLFLDLFFILLLYYIAATYIIPLPTPYSYLAWPIYWIIQGSVQLGLWFVSHDCSHHAFSDYEWLDDTIGFLIETSLFAPYFSLKISHRRHHSNNASLEYDENFVRLTKSDLNYFVKLVNTPPGRIITLVVICTIGWPMYMCFNFNGRKYDSFASHFYPYSPIFNDRERFLILLTDLGLVATSYGLYKVAVAQGVKWLLLVYFGPLAILFGFFSVIAWLQHTHVSLPHYDSTEWDWLRGSLSTVDRDFGVFNTVLHNITDAHVAHHLFTTMPHYHLKEATKAIKPILGEYYQFDGTPIFKSMWREVTECFYVDADDGDDKNKGIYWFSNKM